MLQPRYESFITLRQRSCWTMWLFKLIVCAAFMIVQASITNVLPCSRVECSNYCRQLNSTGKCLVQTNGSEAVGFCKCDVINTRYTKQNHYWSNNSGEPIVGCSANLCARYCIAQRYSWSKCGYKSTFNSTLTTGCARSCSCVETRPSANDKFCEPNNTNPLYCDARKCQKWCATLNTTGSCQSDEKKGTQLASYCKCDQLPIMHLDQHYKNGEDTMVECSDALCKSYCESAGNSNRGECVVKFATLTVRQWIVGCQKVCSCNEQNLGGTKLHCESEGVVSCNQSLCRTLCPNNNGLCHTSFNETNNSFLKSECTCTNGWGPPYAMYRNEAMFPNSTTQCHHYCTANRYARGKWAIELSTCKNGGHCETATCTCYIN